MCPRTIKQGAISLKVIREQQQKILEIEKHNVYTSNSMDDLKIECVMDDELKYRRLQDISHNTAHKKNDKITNMRKRKDLWDQ